MSQITLKQLEAFVVIADLGGFRLAADKLNTTQPNISSRLQSLERQLTRKLMERDSGSVRLTTAGEALLPRARQVLAAMDNLLMAARDNALFHGRLRLGVTEMVVHSWLAEFLATVKKRLPNINVDLTVDISSSLSDALFNGSLDIALQNAPFERPTSAQVELGDFPMIWAAAPQLCGHPDRVSEAELLRHPILTYAKGTHPFQQLQQHFRNKARAVQLVPSTNIAACLQMARKGLGITCVPEAMIREDLMQGLLVALSYGWIPDPLRFAARYDEQRATLVIRETAIIAQQVSRSFLELSR